MYLLNNSSVPREKGHHVGKFKVSLFVCLMVGLILWHTAPRPWCHHGLQWPMQQLLIEQHCGSIDWATRRMDRLPTDGNQRMEPSWLNDNFGASWACELPSAIQLRLVFMRLVITFLALQAFTRQINFASSSKTLAIKKEDDEVTIFKSNNKS